jgi:ankyrin repeat protein
MCRGAVKGRRVRPTDAIDPLTYFDSNGDSLLHIAAQRGDASAVAMLLKGGTDVNRLGDRGCTALHLATSKEVVHLLLANGADPDLRDEFGRLAGGATS